MPRLPGEYERLRAIPTVLVAARRSSSSFCVPCEAVDPQASARGLRRSRSGAPPDMTACLALIPGLGRAGLDACVTSARAKCSTESRARPAQLHALPGTSGLNIAGGCCGCRELRLLTTVVRDGVVCRTRGA